jgi:hypothetical protein
MTPCSLHRNLVALHREAAASGQVRFGGKSPPRSAVCSFHLGSVFKVHPGSSALPLTSYVLDPVSSPPRIICGIPPARLKGGQHTIAGSVFPSAPPMQVLAIVRSTETVAWGWWPVLISGLNHCA